MVGSFSYVYSMKKLLGWLMGLGIFASVGVWLAGLVMVAIMIIANMWAILASIGYVVLGGLVLMGIIAFIGWLFKPKPKPTPEERFERSIAGSVAMMLHNYGQRPFFYIVSDTLNKTVLTVPFVSPEHDVEGRRREIREKVLLCTDKVAMIKEYEMLDNCGYN